MTATKGADLSRKTSCKFVVHSVNIRATTKQGTFIVFRAALPASRTSHSSIPAHRRAQVRSARINSFSGPDEALIALKIDAIQGAGGCWFRGDAFLQQPGRPYTF